MNLAQEVLSLIKESLSTLDKKMLAKGKKYKIFLPKDQGEPLYTANFNTAKEMAKEYGKGTLVIDMTNKEQIARNKKLF